jgi:AcrR family transcriptional regulator
MTTSRPTSRAEQRRRTEARILDAATQVFFSAGYDRATIRAVASGAGVDAGLVMHYFGSKQELYRRVIDAAPVPEVSGTPAEAAEQILAGLADRLASASAASLALLRSMLTNPEAASAASAGIARYEAQIAQAIPAGDADLRAAIISAITLGITVSRHLIKSDELATADPERVIALLRPCVLSLAARLDPSGPPDLTAARQRPVPGPVQSRFHRDQGVGAGAGLVPVAAGDDPGDDGLAGAELPGGPAPDRRLQVVELVTAMSEVPLRPGRIVEGVDRHDHARAVVGGLDVDGRQVLIRLVAGNEVDQRPVGEPGWRRHLSERLAQPDRERVAGFLHERDLRGPCRGHREPQLPARPELQVAHPALEAVGGEPLIQPGRGGPQLPDELRRRRVRALESRGIRAVRGFDGHRSSWVIPPPRAASQQ